MRDSLTARQRMQVAELAGTAGRYALGGDRDRPRDEAVAALHEITADPVVLGHVLGGFLYRVETESAGHAAAVELLRAAGADEATAAAHLAALRERLGPAPVSTTLR